MRAPHVTELAGVDALVYGIPFDTATSYRTGPRFGPEAIRSASALIRPYNPALGVNVVDSLSLVDYGDVPVSPGDTERTYAQVEEALAPIVDAGLFPAFAPGTGTPEVGGFSTAEGLAFLRALRGIKLAGCDVVEVSPPYDGPGMQTALAAANVLYDLLSLRAIGGAP